MSNRIEVLPVHILTVNAERVGRFIGEDSTGDKLSGQS